MVPVNQSTSKLINESRRGIKIYPYFLYYRSHILGSIAEQNERGREWETMKLQRLRGRKICERVLRKGKVWKGKTMVIRWMPGAPRHPAALRAGMPALYVGTLASAKLDKSAVHRNRMRRRCREALRVAARERDINASAQLLLCPLSASLKAPFADIDKDVRLFLSQL